MIKPYYEQDGIVIYLGDCREILPELPKVDLVLTDPPYGSGLSTDFNERFTHTAGDWWKNTDRSTSKRHEPVIGDDEPFDPSYLLNINSKEYVFWGGNWYASRLPDSGGWWIWDKRNGKRDVSQAEWPMSEAEIAWTNIGKGTRIFRHTWFGLIRDSERGEHYHPTQKPVALMKWCLQNSKTSGLVIDPYMGSGSTLRAAKDLHRSCIGIELKEQYCEIAVKRLSQSVMVL